MGLLFGSDLYQREVEYLINREWALTVEDIIWRRSKTGLFMSAKQIASLKDWLQEHGPRR